MVRGWLVLVFFMGLFVSVLNTAAPSGSDSVERFKAKAAESSGEFGGSSSAASSTDGAQDGTVELDRNSDGHFYADVEINGARVHALVDTGATGIALSREDARSVGVAVSVGMPEVVGRGADGDVRGEYVTLDRVALGHRSAENVEAVVLNGGEQTLLGQTFLSKFESVEIRGDKMVLR